MFTLVGLGFKIALVPFHFWAPDVFEGALEGHRSQVLGHATILDAAEDEAVDARKVEVVELAEGGAVAARLLHEHALAVGGHSRSSVNCHRGMKGTERGSSEQSATRTVEYRRPAWLRPPAIGSRMAGES